MVIEDKKIVYVHVRKCAGCSITNAFKDAGYKLDWDRMNFGCFPPEAINDSTKAKYGVWEDYKGKDYKVFTSVRNPFDRLVSGYHYSKFGQAFGSPRPLKFSDFIDALPTRTRNFNWWSHLRMPMSDMLFDDDGLIAEFVIRFENINEDFNKCCEWLGVENVALKKTNASRKDNEYRSLYTEEDKKKVYKMFERDFDNFNYSF